MTQDSSTEPTPDGNGNATTKKGWRRWLAGSLAALVLIGGIAGNLNDIKDLAVNIRSAIPLGDEGSPSPQPSPSDSSTASQTPQTQEGTEVPPGSCLIDDDLAACEGEHEWEVIGAGTQDLQCDASTALEYLGGRSDVDVLSPSAEIRISKSNETGDGYLCLIGSDLRTVQGTAREAFATARGAAFRRCWSEAIGSDISCDQPHDGEYIYWSDDLSVQLSCNEAFRVYADTPYESLSQELSLVAVAGAAEKGCRAESRDTRRLVGSIRRLGASALPFED